MSAAVAVLVGAIAVLCWTWIGYPLCVWMLSRMVAVPAVRDPESWPRVTCVLATRDDTQLVLARVADFLAADYPADRLHVVIGVDASVTELLIDLQAAIDDPRVTLVAGDATGGKPAGLNAAVRAARGEVLVFSDSQQRFAPDAIRRLVAALSSSPKLAAVGGALQLPGDAPDATGRSPVEWYWAMERQLRAAEARLHSSPGVSGSIYAMWHRHWVPMPEYLILDDVWLPMRLVLAGHRVGYTLDARAWDARSTSAVQEKARKVRTLTGNFQLIAWMPALLVPLRNPIWLQFVSHKVLRLLTPWLLLAGMATGALVVAMTLAPLQLTALAATALAGALVTAFVPRLRRQATNVIRWVWSLQVAVVHATGNGLRGQWNVWR